MNQKRQAESFARKMDGFEATFQRFLDSPDYRENLIAHCCHSCQWLYDYGQVLRVELLPDGTWNAPSGHAWSQRGSCLVVLWQVSYHLSRMEAIGETRDFEDILCQDKEEARAVAERLYAHQEAETKEQSLRYFASLRRNGYLD